MAINRYDGICLSCQHCPDTCKQSEFIIWRDDLTKVVADCDDYKKMEVKNDSIYNRRCN